MGYLKIFSLVHEGQNAELCSFSVSSSVVTCYKANILVSGVMFFSYKCELSPTSASLQTCWTVVNLIRSGQVGVMGESLYNTAYNDRNQTQNTTTTISCNNINILSICTQGSSTTNTLQTHS